MIVNNPRFDNSRFVRFLSTSENGLTWKMTSTAINTDFKTVQIDGVWLPPSGFNPVCEAMFNEYERKMLTKVTWKMDNLRIFVASQLYQPAISQASPAMNAPAQQTFDISQKWGWRVWRWNMPYANSPQLTNSKEERATSFLVNGPKSKIFGTMHLGKSRQMNWYVGNYADLRTTYGDLQAYLKHYMRTGLRGDISSLVPPALPDTASYPTLNIQLMPDDPYPTSVMSNLQTVSISISIEFDLHVWSTWKLSKMTQS